MNLEQAYRHWLADHLQRRRGERRQRLERGHKHAEALFAKHIWWPLRGEFRHLHPEYEIMDWRGRPFYADFVWLPGYAKLVIEIKGYNPHVRDLDRKGFREELNRELFLQGMGFRVISFAYDELEQNPELCISLLRTILSHYHPLSSPSRLEKEIIRLACWTGSPITPKQVEEKLDISAKTATFYLRELSNRGWFAKEFSQSGKRVSGYRLVMKNNEDLLNFMGS